MMVPYAVHPALGTSLEIVQMLLCAGCDVNQARVGGWTALDYVGSNASIADALLRGGANPNFAANEWRFTPCHSAGTVEKLELLLRYGGDLRLKNSKGRTPFQFLKRYNNVEHLRPVYEAWTPHKMLPRWSVDAFPLYIDCCDAFREAIITMLLCLRRHRHVIPKDVGMRIVQYVAEMHRMEMWWPVLIDMRNYM